MKKIITELTNHNLPTDEFRNKNKILCLNENPYGCSKNVKGTIINNINYNEYPDDNSELLRRKIANLYKISEDNVVIGNGSGEILQILSRSILNENDEVITCTPTYPYYLVETVIENAKFKEVPLKNNKFDIDGIINSITERTKIIYITNPNNPIGTIISEEEANKLIANTRKDILIVFDEAYYEYVTSREFPNVMEKIDAHDNVCILRTFSKAYGLAAMRVGYLIGSKELIKGLNKVRLTFNISKVSQLAACAAVQDQEFINYCREKNNNAKQKIYNYLNELGIEYIPSETNFIVIKDASKILAQALIKNNIIVKTFKYNNEDCIRLTIGNEKDMEEVESIIGRTSLCKS